MALILVVEDHPQNLKLTSIILKSQGHRVIGAPSALEAERAITSEVPDLIVMDVALPGKDGYTLTRELRRRPETARLPILALSAFAMPGDAEKALSAGCNDYLTKPIRRAALLERVERLLAVSAGSSASPPPAPETSESSRGGNPPSAPADGSVAESSPSGPSAETTSTPPPATNDSMDPPSGQSPEAAASTPPWGTP